MKRRSSVSTSPRRSNRFAQADQPQGSDTVRTAGSISTVRKQLVKDTTWVATTQAAIVLITFANSVFLARELGSDGIGRYQLLLAWVAVAGTAALPGANVVVIRSIVKGYDPFYWLALRYSLVLSAAAAILLLAASWLAAEIAKDNSLSLTLCLIALSIPISALQNYDSVLVGKRAFRPSRLIHLGSAILNLLAVVSAAILTKNIVVVYSAYLAAKLFAGAAGQYIASRLLKRCARDARLDAQFREHIIRQFGLNIFLTITSRVDRIILGAINPSLLGQYYIGIIIPSQIKFNLKVLLSVLTTHMGRLNKKDASKWLSANVLWMLGVGAFLFLCMTLVLPPSIQGFYGGEYNSSIGFGVLFSITLVPSIMINMVGWADQIHAGGRANQLMQVFRGLVFAVATIVLVKYYAALGAVMGWIIADYVIAAGSFFYLRMLRSRWDT